MNKQELMKTAQALVANGKGILAADESTGTIEKRLTSINTPNTETNRRDYREMLFTTDGMEEFISGVILYDETLRQKAANGTPFSKMLQAKGVIPGIKVDAGAKTLPGGLDGEKITEGLDGLSDRLKEYYGLGARFAKWRAVIEIDAVRPSSLCLAANAEALARYAALCQEANIVPIVEPEVLMDGDHDIARCEEVTSDALSTLFAALERHNVLLEGILLKPNMVIPGLKCKKQASAAEVAEATLRCFRRHVPAAVPGIVFLSGGQADDVATANLNAMNAAAGEKPWKLSYSYGRALQAAALKAWGGKPANIAAGKRAFYHRAKMNSMAAMGTYKAIMENAA
ncbi:MAG: fructose-bisphosphate aldolase class I [Proteobacteria bacterium]|nr:fructose-bisphosphate aldolase class I [Pseudomonadota bacterium]